MPDGYMVLFNTKTDWVHTLNPSGALVWEFCDGEHEPREIAAELAAALNAPNKDALEQEVSELIGSLTSQGLLVDTDSASND